MEIMNIISPKQRRDVKKLIKRKGNENNLPGDVSLSLQNKLDRMKYIFDLNIGTLELSIKKLLAISFKIKGSELGSIRKKQKEFIFDNYDFSGINKKAHDYYQHFICDVKKLQ